MTAELLDVLQSLGHLKVGGLGQEETRDGPEQAEKADNQERGLLRDDRLKIMNLVIFPSASIVLPSTQYRATPFERPWTSR